jgi:hypothetical protein
MKKTSLSFTEATKTFFAAGCAESSFAKATEDSLR